MSHDHDSPVPLYEQLAAALRGQIERGELSGRVPSAKSLSQQYEVAQGTAEHALAVLREAGLLQSAMGRGHFVMRGEQRGQRSLRGPWGSRCRAGRSWPVCPNRPVT